MLPQFLKSPLAFFRHHPQERVVLDVGWRSQLPRHLGAQHDQLVNCAIVVEMHNSSLVTIISNKCFFSSFILYINVAVCIYTCANGLQFRCYQPSSQTESLSIVCVIFLFEIETFQQRVCKPFERDQASGISIVFLHHQYSMSHSSVMYFFIISIVFLYHQYSISL